MKIAILISALHKFYCHYHYHYQVWECQGQTESVQGSCSPIPTLCMWDMDCLQPACQTTQRLPHEMSKDPASHQVAEQSARHWSPPACQVWEHPCHSAALSAPVCRPHSMNGRQLSPKKTALWWTYSRTALTRPAKKSNTKTLWKNLSCAVTFPTPHGKRVLKIVLHGAHLWERECWPSKTTASVRKIRSSEKKGKEFKSPTWSIPQHRLPALQQKLPREDWALQPSPHPLHPPVIWSHGLLCQQRMNIIIIIVIIIIIKQQATKGERTFFLKIIFILVIVITKAAPAFFYFYWLETIILNVIVWTKILYFFVNYVTHTVQVT